MRQLSSTELDKPHENAGANDLSDFTGLVSQRVKTCRAGSEIYVLFKGFLYIGYTGKYIYLNGKTNKQTINKVKLIFWHFDKQSLLSSCNLEGGLFIKTKSKACYNSYALLKLLTQPEHFEYVIQW